MRVSRGEAQKYYDEHPGEFQSKRFPGGPQSNIRRALEQKLDRQLVKYLGELKKQVRHQGQSLGG